MTVVVKLAALLRTGMFTSGAISIPVPGRTSTATPFGTKTFRVARQVVPEGCLHLPDEPGLGIRIDRDKLARNGEKFFET